MTKKSKTRLNKNFYDLMYKYPILAFTPYGIVIIIIVIIITSIWVGNMNSVLSFVGGMSTIIVGKIFLDIISSGPDSIGWN